MQQIAEVIDLIYCGSEEQIADNNATMLNQLANRGRGRGGQGNRDEGKANNDRGNQDNQFQGRGRGRGGHNSTT